MTLEPGELLYIPPYWFHEVTTTGLNSGGEEDRGGRVSLGVNVWSSSGAADRLARLTDRATSGELLRFGGGEAAAAGWPA